MGKRNRRRRAEQRRRAARQAATRHARDRMGEGGSSGRSQHPPLGGPPPPLSELVMDAALASWQQRLADRDELIARLAGGVAGSDPVELARAVAGPLLRAVRGCWQLGWQPLDLAHMSRRRLGAAHRRMCADVIGVEAQSYLAVTNADSTWLEQVRYLAPHSVDADHLLDRWAVRLGGLRRAIETAIETLGLLLHVPPLPNLRPPPADWGRHAQASTAGGCDPKVIERVRALLAKAESTSFPEEAEAFTAKAQELITRHAIDRTLLGGHGPRPMPLAAGS